MPGADNRTQPKPARHDSDMQRAIAFERHKEAAAAREARIEAKHPTVFYNDADRAKNNADRKAPESPDARKALDPTIRH
jgi:hypothetical protein